MKKAEQLRRIYEENMEYSQWLKDTYCDILNQATQSATLGKRVSSYDVTIETLVDDTFNRMKTMLVFERLTDDLIHKLSKEGFVCSDIPVSHFPRTTSRLTIKW